MDLICRWENAMIFSTRSREKGMITLLLAALLMAFHLPLWAGDGKWSPCGPGPGLLGITRLAADPQAADTVYAETLTGLFKSTDGGQNWFPLHQDLIGKEDDCFSYPSMGQFAIDPYNPSVVYVITVDEFGKSSLNKSTNGGLNWANIYPGKEVIVLDPKNPAILYTLSGNGGVKSTDGGVSFSPLFSGIISRLFINPADTGTIYTDYLTKTTDGGVTWQGKHSSLPVYNCNALVMDPVSPGRLYIATREGIYKSFWGGEGWLLAGNGLPEPVINGLVMDPSRPDVLYAATKDNGIYKTTNAGWNWAVANTGMAGQQIAALAIAPVRPATLYAGTSSGMVWKSTDSGGRWQSTRFDANPGLWPVVSVPGGESAQEEVEGSFCNNVLLDIMAFAADPSSPLNMYLAVSSRPLGSGNDVLLKSTDGGISWHRTGLAEEITTLAVDPVNPKNVYAGTAWHGICKSTDGGESWTAASIGLNFAHRTSRRWNVSAILIDPTNPAKLHAQLFQRYIAKSTDSGATWTNADDGSGPLPAVPSLELKESFLVRDPGQPSTFYKNLNQSGVDVIYKSTNAGGSWAKVIEVNKLAGPNLSAMVMSPGSPSALYISVKSANNKQSIYKSTDGGNSWSGLSPLPPDEWGWDRNGAWGLQLDPHDPSILYTWYKDSWSSSLFWTLDGGVTWQNNPDLDLDRGRTNLLLATPDLGQDGATRIYIFASDTCWHGDTANLRVSGLFSTRLRH